VQLQEFSYRHRLDKWYSAGVRWHTYFTPPVTRDWSRARRSTLDFAHTTTVDRCAVHHRVTRGTRSVRPPPCAIVNASHKSLHPRRATRPMPPSCASKNRRDARFAQVGKGVEDGGEAECTGKHAARRQGPAPRTRAFASSTAWLRCRAPVARSHHPPAVAAIGPLTWHTFASTLWLSRCISQDLSCTRALSPARAGRPDWGRSAASRSRESPCSS